MWYIYEEEGIVKYSKHEPNIKYITVEKLPKMPVQPGYAAVLTVNYENNTAEYILKEAELNQEEKNQLRINEIHEELERLDAVINRATEDLYAICQAKSYEAVQSIIDTKIKLREELNALLHIR